MFICLFVFLCKHNKKNDVYTIKTQLKNSMLIRYIDNLLDKLLQFCSFPSVHHHSRLLSPTKLIV